MPGGEKDAVQLLRLLGSGVFNAGRAVSESWGHGGGNIRFGGLFSALAATLPLHYLSNG